MIQASWQLAAESFHYVITPLSAVSQILTALCDSVHNETRSAGGRVPAECTLGFRCAATLPPHRDDVLAAYIAPYSGEDLPSIETQKDLATNVHVPVGAMLCESVNGRASLARPGEGTMLEAAPNEITGSVFDVASVQ
jgi:hypothetical protein